MKIEINKSYALALTFTLATFSCFAQVDRNINDISKGENGLPNLITFKENSTYKNSDYFKKELLF
ncbi:MAG TPA: hypothetical protein VF677_02025 [Flavobacterium sp.]|jgi:hypothetical protein